MIITVKDFSTFMTNNHLDAHIIIVLCTLLLIWLGQYYALASIFSMMVWISILPFLDIIIHLLKSYHSLESRNSYHVLKSHGQYINSIYFPPPLIFRQLYIFSTRCRVSAWMIMRYDDARCWNHASRSEHFSRCTMLVFKLPMLITSCRIIRFRVEVQVTKNSLFASAIMGLTALITSSMPFILGLFS